MFQFFHTAAEYDEWMPADLKKATQKVSAKEDMPADKEEANKLLTDLKVNLLFFSIQAFSVPFFSNYSLDDVIRRCSTHHVAMSNHPLFTSAGSVDHVPSLAWKDRQSVRSEPKGHPCAPAHKENRLLPSSVCTL